MRKLTNIKVTPKLVVLIFLAFASFFLIAISYGGLSARDANKRSMNDILLIEYTEDGGTKRAEFLRHEAFCAWYAIRDNSYLIIDNERFFISQLKDVKIIQQSVTSNVRCSYGYGFSVK